MPGESNEETQAADTKEKNKGEVMNRNELKEEQKQIGGRIKRESRISAIKFSHLSELYKPKERPINGNQDQEFRIQIGKRNPDQQMDHQGNKQETY